MQSRLASSVALFQFGGECLLNANVFAFNGQPFHPWRDAGEGEFLSSGLGVRYCGLLGIRGVG